ncbi:MAG: phospholipase D-like domain-containing protein [Anaerolineae bacterium]|nr:phospholipase D-like domain-containing protein [Anaerolineae bacterium]
MLISGVLYDGCQLDDADEAVELVNVGSARAQLIGWELCEWSGDQMVCQRLPDLSLESGSRVWLAHDPTAFEASFGAAPDYPLAKSTGLNNAGDLVMLRTPDGGVADTLVYKDGNPTVPGWSGGTLAPYLGLMTETGQVLSRICDEASGLPVVDTDSASDWMQSLADTVAGRRVRYAGWDLDPLFFPIRVTEMATVVVGIAPDNAFDVIVPVVQRAQTTISIEVYSLRHPAIIDLLVEKARSGVQVTVLLEGGPVGVGVYSPEWQTQLYGCRQLESAGGACWFMIHDTSVRRYQRYLYLHAKMLVVDDTWAVVGTQNLTVGGLPADDKRNGSYGSRGVVVATTSTEVVRRAAQVFSLDLDPAHHQDLLRWGTGTDPRYGEPIDALVDLAQPDGITYTVAFTEPLVTHGTFEFELATAPEAVLRRSDGLLALLERAGGGDTVLVEQLYETLSWGVEASPNPRLDAYIEAARRGAQVRILVNGRSFVDGMAVAEEGALTVAYLTSIALAERLDLQAALGNPTGDGIHNKMVLVDLGSSGQYVNVGSVNGSEASSKVNREVALQLRSTEAFDYLRTMFFADWWRSTPIYLPVVMHAYLPPPPPARYVVISEVAYTDSSGGEWIELHNPTAYSVDLSTHKLGDAETRTSYEPMFSFPPNTSIGAGETLVIAVNASLVPQADVEFYESVEAIPNMIVYTSWGTPRYPLALRNDGDQVVLLGPNDDPTDVIVWGDALYPGVIPHIGVTTIGASLERYPPGIDTNNCAVDLRERYPPTPGVLPQPQVTRSSLSGLPLVVYCCYDP